MKYFLCLFIFLQTTRLYSQQSNSHEIDKMLQVNATAAPEAAALQKYGSIPVDHASGVPKIDFPLCNISNNSLNVDVKLSYHASGIKVQEVASSVGLGFTLFTGGRINRTILDKPDLDYSHLAMYFKTPAEYTTAMNDVYANATYFTDYRFDDFANKISQDKLYRDNFSDIYSVFLPGGASFTFRRDFITGDFEQTPNTGFKIEKITAGFRIKDLEGVVYLFENADDSGWNLTKMTAANTEDYIQFTYGNTQSNYTSPQQSSTYEWGPWVTSQPSSSSENCWQINSTTKTLFGKSSAWPASLNTSGLITAIETPAQKIQFSYSARLDPADSKLDLISVIDKSNNSTVKSIGFSYSYFGTSQDNNRRLKLQSFSVNPGAGNAETYSFSYQETYALPPYYSFTTHNLYHSDYWGYYNGTSSTGNIPMEAIDPAEQSGAGAYYTNKYPDPSYTKTYTIKEVFYPTGGKTLYEFENNEGVIYQTPFYHDGPYNTGKAGGLRVKKIQNYTATGALATEKSYEYLGTCYNQVIGPDQFTYTQRYYFVTGTSIVGFAQERKIAVSNPLEELTGVSPSSVYYAGVKEFTGTAGVNAGYTQYNYSMPQRQENNPYEFTNLKYKHAYQWDYGPETPLLTGTYVYAYKNSTYELLKEEVNTYGSFKQKKFPTGINLVESTTYINSYNGSYYSYMIDMDEWSVPSGFCHGLHDYPESTPASHNKHPQLIYPFQTYGYYSAPLLVAKNETTYLNGSVQKETRYQYELNNLLLSRQSVTTSKSDSLITLYKYPKDFISQQPYTDMVNNLHIYSPVIEQTEYKNSTSSTAINSKKTNYSYWNSSTAQIYPSTVEQNGENLLTYHAYTSNGDVLSVSRTNGSPACYVYSYSGQFPIAKIENASYSSVQTALGGATAVTNFKNTVYPTDQAVTDFIALIRTALSDAQVTTYTYKPLVGMTSQTDPRGQKTTYEYDNFQRLSTIKDHNGNTLKQYCYNYAGQQSTCYAVGVPVLVNTSGGTAIYVRAELENPTNTSGYSSGYYYLYEYADMYYRFYSDAACTQPYTLTSSLDIYHDVTGTYYSSTGSSSSYYYTSNLVPPGSNSYYYSNVETYYYSEYDYDPYWGYLYDSWVYDYNVTTGNGYQGRPTYIHTP